MKHLFLAVFLLCLVGCKEKADGVVHDQGRRTTEPETARTDYPENMKKIFNAHGGLKNWKKKRTLTFDIAKPEGAETHTVDLYSRKDKVEISEVTMGFDSEVIWLEDSNDTYKGNAAVYHNLMFYFYAMPFVFGDPGIKYEKAQALVFGEKSFPGIHISYEDGVGASSKDDYYLHYDPETYRMAWLGYTFTYGSDKKSDDVRWIRYNNWEEIDGALLPKSITWYSYENGAPAEPRDPVVFENISLSETSRPHSFYSPTENGKVVLKPE